MHFLLRTKESLLQKDSLQMEMFILVQLFYDYHSNLVHSKKVSARVFPKTHKKKTPQNPGTFFEVRTLAGCFFQKPPDKTLEVSSSTKQFVAGGKIG